MEKTTKAKYKEKALKVIKKHKLVSLEEVANELKVGHRTLYNHKLNKDDDILEAFAGAKTAVCRTAMLNLMNNSNNPTAQIAIIKLYGVEAHRQALKGESINIHTKSEEDRKKDVEKHIKELRRKHKDKRKNNEKQ